MKYILPLLLCIALSNNLTADPLLFQCDELRSIQVKPSTNETITKEELIHWDSIVENLMKNKPLEHGENCRLYAYLYNAQNAFAEASFSLTGSYSGHVGPVSLSIIQLFYPDFQSPNSEETPFSRELGGFIAKKFEARFKEEQAQLKSAQITMSDATWHGKEPLGLTHPSKMLWILPHDKELACIPPPSQNDTKFWNEQFEEIKKATLKATEAEKQQVTYWAETGDMLIIANKYLFQHDVPLRKMLLARSMLASGMSDALVITFVCKYKYLIKRPFMLDPSFKPYIRTPNHPSYPSAHSTICKTAAVILSYLFPANSQQWTTTAEEAGQSRIWGGIHFSIDNQNGFLLGQQIGNIVISKREEFEKKCSTH